MSIKFTSDDQLKTINTLFRMKEYSIKEFPKFIADRMGEIDIVYNENTKLWEKRKDNTTKVEPMTVDNSRVEPMMVNEDNVEPMIKSDSHKAPEPEEDVHKLTEAPLLSEFLNQHNANPNTHIPIEENVIRKAFDEMDAELNLEEVRQNNKTLEEFDDEGEVLFVDDDKSNVLYNDQPTTEVDRPTPKPVENPTVENNDFSLDDDEDIDIPLDEEDKKETKHEAPTYTLENDDEEDIPLANKPTTNKLDDILSNFNFNTDKPLFGDTNIVKEDDLLGKTEITANINALGSCLSADMSALTFLEKQSVVDSKGSEYSIQHKFFNLIYRKINTLHPLKMSFENWLKVTPELDLESYLFGIYSITYNEKSEYTLKCSNCGHSNVSKFSPDEIDIKFDEETLKYINSLGDDVKKIKQFNVLKRRINHFDKDTGLLFKLKVPSLKDALNMFKGGDKDRSERTVLQARNHIASISKLDKVATLEKGVPVFTKIDEKLYENIITNLKTTKYLNEAVNKITKDRDITYTTPSFTCTACDSHNNGKEVSIHTLLFTLLMKEF